LLFDGWVVRFAKGFTKRANSVNPLFASYLANAEKVDRCERLYAERGLPTVFRLTSIASPPELDHFLDRRHYTLLNLASVQHCDLRGQVLAGAPPVQLQDETLDEWFALYCRVSGVAVAEQQVHKEILQAIPAVRLLAVLTDADRVVACGLGVLEDEYFGLFDLVTDGAERNKGYGGQLVSGMLRWAQERGAVHAYLQVLKSNAPAQRLYAKLGFEELYQYWYRVRNG
jgi:ribosomal protein S18 acetylase RimI-like enzyme